MTRHPSVRALKISDISSKYAATFFRDALARYIVHENHPNLSLHEVERASAGVFLPFSKIPVYHRIKVWIKDVFGLGTHLNDYKDIIHVQPARQDKHGTNLPARFDTILVRHPNHGATADQDSIMCTSCCSYMRPVISTGTAKFIAYGY